MDGARGGKDGGVTTQLGTLTLSSPLLIFGSAYIYMWILLPTQVYYLMQGPSSHSASILIGSINFRKITFLIVTL